MFAMDTWRQTLSNDYRYAVIFGAYLAVTGFAFWRIARQPYTRSIKWDQYETVFKATTLAGALGAIGLGQRKLDSSGDRKST